MSDRKGSFAGSIDELLRSTPDSSLTGRVVVDQIYAHYQHEHPEFHHPRGGQAFYLQQPLYVKYRGYLTKLGKAALQGKLRDAMVANVEDLSHQVMLKAPWEYMDLRNSGHPQVEQDGKLVYDRPPLVRRLSDEELKHKGRYGYLSRRNAGRKR